MPADLWLSRESETVRPYLSIAEKPNSPERGHHRVLRKQHALSRFATASPLGFSLYGAFPVKRLFWVC